MRELWWGRSESMTTLVGVSGKGEGEMVWQFRDEEGRDDRLSFLSSVCISILLGLLSEHPWSLSSFPFPQSAGSVSDPLIARPLLSLPLVDNEGNGLAGGGAGPQNDLCRYS